MDAPDGVEEEPDVDGIGHVPLVRPDRVGRVRGVQPEGELVVLEDEPGRQFNSINIIWAIF